MIINNNTHCVYVSIENEMLNIEIYSLFLLQTFLSFCTWTIRVDWPFGSFPSRFRRGLFDEASRVSRCNFVLTAGRDE